MAMGNVSSLPPSLVFPVTIWNLLNWITLYLYYTWDASCVGLVESVFMITEEQFMYINLKVIVVDIFSLHLFVGKSNNCYSIAHVISCNEWRSQTSIGFRLLLYCVYHYYVDLKLLIMFNFVNSLTCMLLLGLLFCCVDWGEALTKAMVIVSVSETESHFSYTTR